MLARFVLVCFAGACGTGLRYLVGVWAGEKFGPGFPLGTLLVNLAGCFLIALILHVALNRADFSPELRVILTTGFVGGLTTYSSFNYETTKLLQTGATTMAITYLALTLFGCFVMGVGGLLVAQRIVGQ